MSLTTKAAVLSVLLAAAEAAPAPGLVGRDVDTKYPYKGPAIPVGDWADQTVNGNGQGNGYPRLVEAPAVAPASSNPTNNVNVISYSYIPNGMNIHFQTPFGLGKEPCVHWGTTTSLGSTTTGHTDTYDRTPPCSLVAVTQCSQHFHNVQLTNLSPNTTYYYQIPAANGTTESQILSFETAPSVGDQGSFTVAVINDMGYTNAQGTHQQLSTASNGEVAFVWHGGDLSYADDWYSGILPCTDSWPVCYNGTSSSLPNTPPAPYPVNYNTPLPSGEVPSEGSPNGGDMSVLYESNWDLWQQWQNNVTMAVPYMVLPGNHEAACAEFDGPGNPLTAYLNNDQPDSTAPKSGLNYYSCPESQRNFTTFQHRFRMPGPESGGVGNMWYSFDYGFAHFISLDGETDFAYSPEWPFLRDLKDGESHPTAAQTYITDSGPFGTIDDNNWKDNNAYQQIQWLKADLAAVNRTATPWIIAMSHRPMYSSQTASYQRNLRAAFQDILLDAGVDAYIAGHIHWYERLFPLASDGSIDTESIVNDNTYVTNPGTSMTHLINGAAGNIESHSTINPNNQANITAVLNQYDFGFSLLTFNNASALTWQYIKGDGTGVGDTLTLLKNAPGSS